MFLTVVEKLWKKYKLCGVMWGYGVFYSHPGPHISLSHFPQLVNYSQPSCATCRTVHSSSQTEPGAARMTSVIQR
jgi:hypothetical protein